MGGDVSKDSVANARYAQTLRLPSIQSTIASAQRAFANWAKSAQRSKPELLENLSGDFSKLLDALTIARSRRQIQNFFGDEMSKIGGFPKREKPQSEYIEHIDSQHQFPDFANVAQQLSRLKLVIYSPSSFLRTDLSVADQSKYNALRGATLTQAGREKALVGIMKVMFLKRLESSVHAFALTLERTVINIDALLPKIARYQAQSGDVAVVTGEPDEQDRDDDNADEFIVGKKLEYQLAHLDLGRWQTQLQEDRAVLVALLASARAVNVARDTKLARIKELLIKKLAQSRRKVIVFSAFAETAQYLYKSLKDELLENHQAHSGLVTGSSAMQNLHPRRIKFNEVLSDFSPQSKKRSPTIHGQLDILFATDCISEGQNLQDCDTVINCDIHWNPVRIIQRFGRIDRIGSRATSVQMINFWPTPNLDQYLGLVHRVEARMSLVDAVATQSDNPLQPTPTDLDENNLRNQQLKRLSEEVIDLEQDEQSVTLADLTLDEFRQDLQQFLNAQRQELEEAPLGLFAVVPPDPQIHLAEAGILFCLRDKPASNSAEAATDSPLPQHRYYLLYVRDDGLVRLIHHQAKQVLNLWRALSMGKTTAYSDLCRAFDRQTQNGQDMSQTTALLKAALASITDTHIDVAAHKITSQRDFILPPKLEERLSDERTFELVTWLVIQGKPI
ncbi:MAG: C-terminal helicase domain-containing protein [Methylophilaceae bacterium]|nr:C-terminal helicase domain-containing protein [Methylophilaceae bacterium]